MQQKSQFSSAMYYFLGKIRVIFEVRTTEKLLHGAETPQEALLRGPGRASGTWPQPSRKSGSIWREGWVAAVQSGQILARVSPDEREFSCFPTRTLDSNSDNTGSCEHGS